MAGIVVLDTPQPESRPEVIEALRLAIHYATLNDIKSISITFIAKNGKPVTFRSDE